MAPGPGVSRVHGAKLQITGRNRSQNLQSSRVSSPRPSLGPSPSLWPIWRCLSSEALPGASVQDGAWQEAAGEEDNSLDVHLLWMQRGGGEGFPRLDILHQKNGSLFFALKCSTPSTSSAFPGQDAAPGTPQTSRILQTCCKPQRPGAAGPRGPRSAACACPADPSGRCREPLYCSCGGFCFTAAFQVPRDLNSKAGSCKEPRPDGWDDIAGIR